MAIFSELKIADFPGLRVASLTARDLKFHHKNCSG